MIEIKFVMTENACVWRRKKRLKSVNGSDYESVAPTNRNFPTSEEIKKWACNLAFWKHVADLFEQEWDGNVSDST